MDYSYKERLKSVIGNSFTKPEQIRKYVGGLINTQPVAPLGSEEQYITHFEVVKGDERFAMPSDENNLFYCVAVIFFQMLQEHRKGDGRTLSVQYGDHEWVDAINFIFSYDSHGRGGIL